MCSVNYCIFGLKGWCFVHPEDNELFYEKVGTKAGKEEHQFKCFMRNKEFFFDIEDLDRLNIRYTIIYQKPGQLIVTFPAQNEFF